MKLSTTRCLLGTALAFAASFCLSCSSNDGVAPPEYVTGKNVYTTEVDGDAREYIVHVPTGYDPNSATPAVLMLHGGGGSGEGMYSNSGWKEVGESQTILTIFPTALEYCYTNWLGQTRFATRWHSLNRSVFCVGQTLKDDVAFLRQLIAELKRNYNVDADRPSPTTWVVRPSYCPSPSR
jgi:poly(3-hydroxybutyrate) depolymerase